MNKTRVRNWAIGAVCVVGLSACHPISSCGIGPLSVGMPQDQAEQAGFDFEQFETEDCGRYRSDAPNDDHLDGLGRSGRVTWIQTANPSDRLGNGLGPGSTYADIKAVYGDQATVHFPGVQNEVGVHQEAQYVPVVIVRVGANAITFEMLAAGSTSKDRKLKDSAVAEFVKVGTWETRGDDEGCA